MSENEDNPVLTPVKALDIGAIQQFDCKGDAMTCGSRWKKWKRSFLLFITAKGIQNLQQKCALLLHSAGPDVQDIFYTLPGTEGHIDFDAAIKKLDDYFIPAVNVPYERHLFCQMAQLDQETVDQYITRLTERAKHCEFGASNDDNIRDQVVDKCKSFTLRRKFLEKGGTLTLKLVQEIARAHEVTDEQIKEMDSKRSEVNAKITPSITNTK